MKIIILILFFSIKIFSQNPLLNGLFDSGVETVIPSYSLGSGAVNGGAGVSAEITLPATISANDIIIIQFNMTNYGFNPQPILSLPSGWAVGDSITGLAAFNSTYAGWIWKRAVGNEGGTTVEVGGSELTDIKGTAISFSGCIESGDFYEAKTNRASFAASAELTSQEITTLGDKRLAVCLINVMDDNVLSVGMTNYTTKQDVKSSVGIPDAQFVVVSQDIESAGVVALDTATNGASDAYYSFTFAIIPK